MKTTPDWKFTASTSIPERGIKTRRIARITLWITIIDLLAVAAAPLARLYLHMATMSAFQIFFGGIFIGLLLAVFGLLFAIVTVFMGVAPAWKRGLIVAALGIAPAAAVTLYLGPERIRSPTIHDITTDTEHPPAFFQARKLRSANENSLDYGGAGVAKQQQAAYPGIKPIIEKNLNGEEAMTRVVQVVLGLNWTLVNADFDTGIVEAYDTTRVFGFTDDIVIRVQAQETGSRIDIRSASRVGLGDAGMNAARIRSFIAAF